MNLNDVQQIVDEVLEGNQERIDELPELMKDAAFRKQYLSLMIDESILSNAVELEAKKKSFKRKSQKPALIPIVFVVAASLLFVFGIFHFKNSETPALVLEGDSSYSIGQSIPTGTTVSLSEKEKLVLELVDKSKLTLKGPFRGKYIENGFYINKGILDAHIQKREKNKFFVRTDQCQIEVIGTKFSVSALGKSSQLKVSEGEVKVSNEEKSLAVTKGEFVLAAPTVPFELFKDENKNLPDEIWLENYKHNIQKDLSSHDLFCLYSFEEKEILQNLKGNYLHGAIPISIKSAKGRHGKAAREFKDSMQEVIEFPEYKDAQLKDFSAILWCKADSISENNVLFSQRDFDKDSLGGWSIHIIGGELAVWLVTGIKQNGEIDWAKKEIAPFPLNKWAQIALTVEGEIVSVFLNGELLKEMNIKWLASKSVKHLVIGGIDLMSYKYQNMKRPRNIFNGVIDEVRLYKKSLSKEAIQKLYMDGKP